MEARSNSGKETQKIAASLAKELIKGDIIALFGNLGAGKTTFVQGLAAALGITRRILSPTFVFVRSYPVTINAKRLTFHHLDLYRTQEISDFSALGLDEIFDGDSIAVIEWADKIKKSLPKKRIDVFFEQKSENERIITIRRNK